MSRYEENEFRMKPIDPEFQAYVVQRKTLNEQIQDHWKLELNTHVILGVFNRGVLYFFCYANWFRFIFGLQLFG